MFEQSNNRTGRTLIEDELLYPLWGLLELDENGFITSFRPQDTEPSFPSRKLFGKSVIAILDKLGWTDLKRSFEILRLGGLPASTVSFSFIREGQRVYVRALLAKLSKRSENGLGYSFLIHTRRI
jgi:hypothetical protein